MATERSAQLGDYTFLLRRQWWVVVAAVAVAIGLAATYTAVATPEYTSTTSVLVSPTGTAGTSSSGPRTTINMDTEAQIITSTEVMEAVADWLNFAGDPRELAERVSISVPPNTEILDISFTGLTAADARWGAEAFASAYLLNREDAAASSVRAQQESLQARIADLDARLAALSEATAALPSDSASRAYNQAQAANLNDQLGDLSAQLNALDAFAVRPGEVITQASLPASPSSPQPLLSLAAGALGGLLLGVGLAVLRQRSDRYVRQPDDVDRQTGLPVLADLPASMDPDRVRLATSASLEGRNFTRLRNIVTAGSIREARVVLVAGVGAPAGAIAANLAASLARSGEPTVLVCGDVHADTDVQLFGRSSDGLAEVLVGRATAADAMRSVPSLPDLQVLGPGRDRDLAAELLQTSAPRALIDDLLETATWVVMEAPATDAGADAQTLARYADFALLVVQVNVTTTQAIVDARAQFESMRTPVVGAAVLPAPARERGTEAGDTTDEGEELPASPERAVGPTDAVRKNLRPESLGVQGPSAPSPAGTRR
ncbi:capsular polysaccharide biosynthesis protein [Blastococcus colisei]|uniref:Capsular polysaccharide biosynthesis protein n=1 Tax=Blastococcus colisei TaxID=1564162 RepID=A0A543P0F5_9ACTN|nr:Wzz/FepE/Etk N-terminal domain-containing protein [Blastococcus colisei]TQN37555.1 capsular polysaccharide biosynthesis protein [Blastococcus colisei]